MVCQPLPGANWPSATGVAEFRSGQSAGLLWSRDFSAFSLSSSGWFWEKSEGWIEGRASLTGGRALARASLTGDRPRCEELAFGIVFTSGSVPIEG